jgi:general secretion pathway protein L
MSADSIVANEKTDRETVSTWLGEWIREVRAAWDEFWSPLARENARALHVTFTDSGVSVEYAEANGEIAIAAIMPGTDENGRLLSSALSEACGRAKTRDVTITLPAGEILRPHVRLPYVARRAIRPMLGFELERLSPLPLHELYFDFQLASRDRKAGRTEVDLRIVKRDIVDKALAAIRAAGCSVNAIRFPGDEAPAEWRQFPVDRIALLRAHWRRHGVAWLAGLSLVFAIAIVLAAYVRGLEVREAVFDQIETQQIDAAQVERVRNNIADARAQIEFAFAKKSAQPFLLSTLSALSDALPDGTWLSELSLQGRKAHAQGYSHSASDLIALIDRSPRFANAQFNAPVVQSSNKLDRFDITFDIKAGDIKAGDIKAGVP